MHTGHWIMIGLTAALLGALWLFSSAVPAHSRGYRLLGRVFWAFSLLWISGGLGGVGLNGISLAATCALGLPGYGALWMLTRL